ncbi:MAG: YlbL family protein [Chloroflexota bacterium]
MTALTPRRRPFPAAPLRPLTSSWLLTSVLTLSTVALVVSLLFAIPTPYQILLPGPVTDVQRLIEPNPTPSEGALYLTTIYSDPASVGEWLYAKLNPEAGIVPREEARPEHISEREYQKLLVSMMDESKVAAKVVALREAGYDVKITGQGAQIQEIAETSKAKGILQPGDVIVGADGEPIATANDLVALIPAHRPGETIRLEVKRAGDTLTVEVPLGESPEEPGRARVGIVVLTHLFEYELPRELHLKTEDIGGPSGGLMFALGVYDAVMPAHLTKGQDIAGTGTISTDGEVGAVGGVKYKVWAAEKAGADLFLAPAGNYDEAKRAATAMRVVSVRTFKEALNVLSDLPPAA